MKKGPKVVVWCIACKNSTHNTRGSNNQSSTWEIITVLWTTQSYELAFHINWQSSTIPGLISLRIPTPLTEYTIIFFKKNLIQAMFKNVWQSLLAFEKKTSPIKMVLAWLWTLWRHWESGKVMLQSKPSPSRILCLSQSVITALPPETEHSCHLIPMQLWCFQRKLATHLRLNDDKPLSGGLPA